MENKAIHRQACTHAGMTKKNLLVLGLSIIILSCARTSPNVEIPQPLVTAVIHRSTEIATAPIPALEETAIPESSPQAEPPILPPENQYTKYILIADFDYRACTLDVAETIRYVNTTDSQLTLLPLIIDPNRRKDVFTLEEITWGDGTPVSDYSLQGGTLLVELHQPIQPGESVELRLTYHLDIPYTAGVFGATGRQVNLANWYAFVPAYSAGVGWRIHDPGRAGEYFAYDVADYAVTIRLIGRETAVTLAAGVSAEVFGNEYRYIHQAARNFSWSASTDYVIVWSRAGNVVITGYVFPEHEQTGLLAAGFVSEAVLLFNDLFGNVPQSSISFVEADFSDGMEYEGIYFLEQVYFNPRLRSAQSGLASLTVHETSHQWWGGLVANDQALEPWLDEALATFSELIFYEQRYPHLVDWWWEYRVDSFRPKGAVNASIYQFKDFRSYVNAVYLRGVRFMDAIRTLTGNEVFLAFLREYAHVHAYHLATADDFFATLTRFTTTDLTELKKEYFLPHE